MRLANAFIAASENGPEIATRATRSIHRRKLTFGVSESSGRVVTWAIADSTSDSAFCMSVCWSNSRMIEPEPSRAEETTSVTPSRKRTSGSMAPRMLASTSSALAPGQATVTVMFLTSRVGKNWIGMRPRAKTPAISIRTIRRLAALGWRANSDTTPERSSRGQFIAPQRLQSPASAPPSGGPARWRA